MAPTPSADIPHADRESIKATIRDHVSGGIKGVELACEIAGSHPHSVEEALDVLRTMVADGEVVEVEYVTPENDDGDMARVKSFYLPAGTRVRLERRIPA